MAIMHPNKVLFFATYSEEQFYNACRTQLSDKYHVFYSVKWFTTTDNGIRENSESDFLIFNPDYGYLCVEVKGGKGISVENGKWYIHGAGERELKRSPYEQAEQSMRFFKQYFEEETEMSYEGVYGYLVAFPNFAITNSINASSPMELTIDVSSMDNLPLKLVSIFRYWQGKTNRSSQFLSVDNRKKFINTVNKRLALSIAAGALIKDKERELEAINTTQNSIIDCLINYPRAFIIGGAGTGKTWIGVKKIQRCVAEGGKALFLCYNKSLAEEISCYIDPNSAKSINIDAFATSILKDKLLNAKVDKNGCKEYFELLSDVVELPKFDLVIVDEAQDFTEDLALTANLFLKDPEKSTFYVFYDENQNIFNRNFKDKFLIEPNPFVLRYNIRNTSNIYDYTCENTRLGLDTESNMIEGVEPEHRTFGKKTQLLSFLDSTVNRLIKKEGIENSKIIVLSDRKLENSVLKDVDSIGGYNIVQERQLVNNKNILYRTIQSFKGLESDIVIYINHTYVNRPKTHEYRALLYTAYTRARFYLYSIDYEKKEGI